MLACAVLVTHPTNEAVTWSQREADMYYKLMAGILLIPWFLLALTVVGHIRARLGRAA